MIKWIETTGRSEEDAIAAALFQLGLERDDVSVEVIERAKSGFLGFGSNPAKVRVSYEEENGVPKAKTRDEFKIDVFAKEEPKPVQKPAPKAPAAPVEQKARPVEEKPAEAAPEAPAAPVEEETILAAKPGWQPPKKSQPRPERREQPRKSRPAQLQEGDEVLIGESQRPAPKAVTLTPAGADDEKAQKIGQFLTGLMEHLDVQAEPEIFTTDEGGYKVILQGKGLGAIIGRRGETLDAIQQLTNYSVNHGQSKRVRIHVDAEGYRAKREESLQRLAVKVAGKVVKYRKNMTLEPMNAYERHVIHTALQDYPNVTTYSTGVEPNRRTVVAYAPGQK
ncbi:RNA-binding cell elongation regulator Jag/EloR [Pseudoflavonifractor phocaeensis]|uniref:RNA-binding cell elongation regulator Jag/EloR n=1 Tax=Pseudoflavonifractor phocaeensis TaxID=1870988 RepID=UPI001F3AA77B|nr:RNA-binding cell elongation regulator Jag/EloR [Pseudoflavonifractor phocaeensis]MCF2596801.1 Jag N-terminal domain-containing protein [Pseudoflavonifractor phocaeensis]